jgi:serine/threonine-protein kinase
LLELTDIKPGDTLGRYELLTPVAHGGMASVWAARMVGSRGFQKLVAVKTMLPALSEDPEFETMFLDEARLASRIHHPHVVEIADLGDEHGWLYIVMEWVDGDTIFTLNKRAKATGGIPLPLLLRIVSNACAGLHAAHELRDEKTGQLLELVHRDISPQNIMVSSNGIVKIVDFGVAKAHGRLHTTIAKGLMKGKVPYGSPEQISGSKLDRRSDIFSLGVLMYAMTTGLHPFRGESDKQTMDNILKRAPVPLRNIVPSVPADVEAIVLRALEKDPADRWPDCAAMQRAIDQVISNLGAPVTDGDVGAFVKKVAGDRIEERRAKLSAAIEHADNAPAALPASESGANRRQSGARGGMPLPATFAGIIPVSLDDAPPPPPSATTKTHAAMAISPAASASVVTSGRPRRSVGIYVLLAALAGFGGLAYGMRAGHLPWLTERLAFLAGARATSPGASPESTPPGPSVLAEVPTASPAPSPSSAPADPSSAAADDPAPPALADPSAPAPDAPSGSASAAAAAPSARAPARPPVNAQPRQESFVPRTPSPRPKRKLLGNPYD